MSRPKGYYHLEKTKNKIRKSLIGHQVSQKTRIKIGIANKGKIMSDEAKKKISFAFTGVKHPMYGKKHTAEALKKIKENTPVKYGENSPNWKGGKKEYVCKICKKIIIKYKCQVVNYKNVFCSTKCKQIFLSGKNNHWWKGGLSNYPYPLEWKDTLKKAIKERDNYVCQICNKQGSVVHHIDYNKSNLDLKNLVTLCVSCHSKTNKDREEWRKCFEKRIY